MAFNDLRAFIRALEKQGELKRVTLDVDPYLEMTEFADRAVKKNGPALLFENPKGSKSPVLINAFASMRRMELALGVSKIDEVAGGILGVFGMEKAGGLVGKMKVVFKIGGVVFGVSKGGGG